MMPVEIDPSEVRRPRGDPREGLRARLPARLGRPAMLAALGLVGVGGFAGLAAAAYPAISDMLRPRPSQVHFGRVADMPEIKDGIPALRTTPVRQVPLPQAPGNPTPVLEAAATSDAAPPLAPPVAPAALLDPKPNALTQGAPARGFSVQGAQAQGNPAQGNPAQGNPAQGTTVRSSGSPAADVAATGTAAAFQPVPAASKPRETPRPVVASREAVTPRTVAVAREPVPLPPVRAVEAKPAAATREKVAEPKATPRPMPAREAKAEAKPEPKPAPSRHAAEKPVAEKRPAEKQVADKPVARREKSEAHQRSAAVQPATAPAAEEPTRFLGVPMPDLAPAGRAIRETVDAVISLPSRL